MSTKRKTRRPATEKKPSGKPAETPATRSRAATAASSEPSAEVKRAEEQFKRGLMIRGEAAYPDESGKLPLDATHEIVEPAEEGGTSLPAVKRVRFKIF